MQEKLSKANEEKPKIIVKPQKKASKKVVANVSKRSVK